MPTIRITSKRDGFRRCGVVHPAGATVYTSGAFTPEQIEAMRKDPTLVVEILPDAESESVSRLSHRRKK